MSIERSSERASNCKVYPTHIVIPEEGSEFATILNVSETVSAYQNTSDTEAISRLAFEISEHEGVYNTPEENWVIAERSIALSSVLEKA